MDFDIEMDIDDVQEQNVPAIPEAYTHDIITGEEQEPGEIEDDMDQGKGDSELDQTVMLNKIHLRGLDTFNPNDVKDYVSSFSGSRDLIERIEWIDDSSANIVFREESFAQSALVSLAEVEIADATQMPPGVEVRAKSYDKKPESVINIRFAVASDKKVVGAASRSRFYLLNPEYDPEERRRRGEFNNRRYRDRDDGRGRDRRNGRRRDDYDDEPRNTFDVNLYDDDPAALARRIFKSRRSRSRSRSQTRRASVSSESAGSPRPYARNSHKDIYRRSDRMERDTGRLARYRSRSASPVRGRDGDAHMDMDNEARHSAALRSREKGRAMKERLSAENKQRELFPSKVVSRDSGPKELFPSKVSTLSAGKAQMDQLDATTAISTAKLADRITPATSSDSFNIRGTANKRGNDQGFSIKGKATSVKELFPEKFGNAGKELFAEKLEGRGRRRQKAEDLFY